jgi:hypothetical protein
MYVGVREIRSRALAPDLRRLSERGPKRNCKLWQVNEWSLPVAQMTEGPPQLDSRKTLISGWPSLAHLPWFIVGAGIRSAADSEFRWIGLASCHAKEQNPSGKSSV